MGSREKSGDRRPTIGDVAVAAGVSRGTVSRVLSDERYVSAHAVAVVRQAVLRLGFVPNLAARSLASKTTRSVAVLVDGASTKLTGDSNTAVLVLAFQAHLALHGYRPVFQFLAGPGDDETAAMVLLGGFVDGALLLSDEFSVHVMDALSRTGLPAVITCSPEPGSGLTTVAIDDESAASEVTAHLLQSGRRRIAMIAVGLDRRYGRARLRGFMSATGAFYDPQLVLEAEAFTFEAGYDAMMKLYQAHPDVEGVFVASDVVAAGAMQALTALGCRVPEDIGVAGFDGNEWSQRCKPHLTTVHQPLDEVGRLAASTLLDLIAGRKPASITVNTEILARESA